jgi:hypothetical protein
MEDGFSLYQYFFATLPFLVIVYALLVVQKKEVTVKKTVLIPVDAGWVYLLERDGFIKVGMSKYYGVTGAQKLSDRLNVYVNNTSEPNPKNLNVLYFHFYDNVVEVESLLKNYLSNNHLQEEKLVDTDVYNKMNHEELKKDIQNAVLENIEKPIYEQNPNKKEWYNITNKHDFFQYINDIIQIMDERRSRANFIEDITQNSIKDLQDQPRIFLHQLPKID